MINGLTAEKVLSDSTDVGGMDSNAVVILVMFTVFSPVASNFLNCLVMLQLIARLVWDVLWMHSVSFLLLSLISRTALQFCFDLGRLTESNNNNNRYS